MAELFVEEPVMYEPTNVVRGREAISTVAGNLLGQFGTAFRIVPNANAVSHHGLGSLRWQAGPERSPVIVTGADVAEFEDGRIARPWVLLNPPV